MGISGTRLFSVAQLGWRASILFLAEYVSKSLVQVDWRGDVFRFDSYALRLAVWKKCGD